MLLAIAQDVAAGGTSGLVVGGSVAIALGLVETVKVLVAKIGGASSAAFGARDRSMLHDLHNWHAPEAGRQEWKNPEVRELLGEIRDQLVELNANLRGRAGD